MRKQVFILILLIFNLGFSQQKKTVAFKDGEWLKFRMSYSGFLKAGEAELTLKKTTSEGKKVFHANGTGRTTGMIDWFFKVRDNYQSYFDSKNGRPYLFKRDVNEGGYKIRKDIKFDHARKKAIIKNILHKKDTVISIGNVQDMISTFYFLRSQDTSKMKAGDEIDVNMFFDEQTYRFKLRFLGYEILKTKFGKIKTKKFRPIVKAGRVFKAKESVTIWITADDNKIPIKLRAELAVGSLRAELDAYKGLANPFQIIF